MRKRISLDPYDEPAHRRLMELQAAHGDRAGALRTYQRLTRLLELDLGVAPDPVTARTLAGITAPAAALDASPAAADASPEAAAGSPEAAAVPEAADAPGEREPGRARRRTRLGALTASIAVVAALAGGATIQGGDPATAAAVPANAVTELDASGTVVASAPGRHQPGRAGGQHGTRSGSSTPATTPCPGSTPRRTRSRRRSTSATPPAPWPSPVTTCGSPTSPTGPCPASTSTAGRTVDTIHVGNGPDAIAAGPAGLWVANSLRQHDPAHRHHDAGPGPSGRRRRRSGRAGRGRHLGVGRQRQSRFGDADRRRHRGPDAAADPGGQRPAGHRPARRRRLGGRRALPERHPDHGRPPGTRTRSTSGTDRPRSPPTPGRSGWPTRYSGDLVRIDPRTEEQDRIDLRTAVNGLAVADGRLWVASGAFASTSHRGGTLRVAAGALPGQLRRGRPRRALRPGAAPGTPGRLRRAAGLPLQRRGPPGARPRPGASVPEPTDDGTTYTFNLRPGIRYSTGAEVRASDVDRGVRRALDPGPPTGLLHRHRRGPGVPRRPASCDLSTGSSRTTTQRRVTFHLVAPDPEFLWKLTMLVVPAPPGTPPGRLTSPLPSTGPYRVAASAGAGTHAHPQHLLPRVVRGRPAGRLPRRHQLGEGAPTPGPRRTRCGTAGPTWPSSSPSAASTRRVAVARRRAAGLGAEPPPQQHRCGTGFVVVNSSLPPVRRRPGRRAFNFAFDRTKAVELLGGPSVAIPTCQLLPPGMPSYRPYCPYTHRPPERRLPGARTWPGRAPSCGLRHPGHEGRPSPRWPGAPTRPLDALPRRGPALAGVPGDRPRSLPDTPRNGSASTTPAAASR